MSERSRDVGVVVVAGGTGSRTGSAELKQFRWVAGKPMLLHSVQTFQRRADVAIERLVVSVGGRERAESVYNGLEDLPDEVRVVLVHDAARPLVTPETIDRVVVEARQGRGAVAALPV